MVWLLLCDIVYFVLIFSIFIDFIRVLFCFVLYVVMLVWGFFIGIIVVFIVFFLKFIFDFKKLIYVFVGSYSMIEMLKVN